MMSKTISRRAQKRLMAKEGTFAIFNKNSSKLGQIIEINPAGFSFRYCDSQFIDNDRDWQAFLYHDLKPTANGIYLFDLFLANTDAYVDRVPCRIISNFEIEDTASNNSISMKRCGIQFDQLSPDKKSDLDIFIKSCT
ncbi:MAG: hypothetical protein QNI92_16645 [Desulfobacterales bacterium]|nr:hypothetical protein [Desulfobacterales bacterium]MDJ0915314.1 hypothetical protein [Desulfobacterales bacterium]